MESADLNAKGDGTTSRAPEFVNQATSFSVSEKFGLVIVAVDDMTQEPASSKEQLATVVVNRGILHLSANL